MRKNIFLNKNSEETVMEKFSQEIEQRFDRFY